MHVKTLESKWRARIFIETLDEPRDLEKLKTNRKGYKTVNGSKGRCGKATVINTQMNTYFRADGSSIFGWDTRKYQVPTCTKLHSYTYSSHYEHV